MLMTLAAIGAIAVATLQSTIAPYLRIGGAQPDLLFVAAVVWTVVAGIDTGLVWAFLGGITIDLLAPRPLGSTAFTLLLVVGAAALLSRATTRGRYIAPIAIVFVLSIVSSGIFSVVYAALRSPINLTDPAHVLLPAAVYDAVLAALIGPLAIAIRARREEEDRIGW
jgi:rod shape-determining protein MreD